MRINFFQLTSRRQTSRQDKAKSSLPLKQGKSPKGGMGYSETGEVPGRGMGYDVSLTFRMVIPALSRELKKEDSQARGDVKTGSLSLEISKN